MAEPDLLHRWEVALLATGCEVEEPIRLAAGRDLLERWREPHRRYHDLEHLSEVLRALDVLATPPGTAQLAAFFHDAVYRGEPGKDEEQSALVAIRSLATLLPHSAVVTVAAHVRSTIDHDADSQDGRALNDADLAVLAAPRERYDRYVAGVRAEYARYSNEQFRAGRIAVLSMLLQRPRLFATDTGYLLWEGPSRLNLSDELRRHGSA
jgi:predicted metal-dependent HD superfamily phosphohydrolase